MMNATFNIHQESNFLEKSMHKRLKQELFNPNFPWLSEEEAKVKVWGKWHNIPRKQQAFYFNGQKLCYKFSNNLFEAKPARDIPVLVDVKNFLESKTGDKYNFVLVNLYKDGRHCVGWHRDDESEMNILAPIASISIGQHRDFVFRDYTNKKVKRKFELKDNDLLIMKYPTNLYWEHSLPKRSVNSAPLPRVNLTFRRFLPQN